ncbi:MAG: phage major capsid protein [Rubrivivax sp.]|nr:phage major capsid protein [Rubrivivax sp.]
MSFAPDTPITPAVDAVLRAAESQSPTLRYRARQEAPPFNLAALLLARTEGKPLPEDEATMCSLWSRAAGEAMYLGSHDWIGWGALAQARAMSVESGPKGGYMIGGAVGPMVEALRGDSIAIALGARVVSGLTEGVTFPREVVTGTASWIAAGTAPPTDAEPTLGGISVGVHTCVALSDFSLQLLRSEAGATYAPRIVTANAGEALDKAVINGAGGAEPLGILRTPGVTTVSGASITWATIAGMRETSLAAGAREDALVWLGAPNVQKLLSSREKASGSGFIWANGAIDGIRAVATKRVPDGTLVLVPMGTVLIAGFGPGPTVEMSQSSGFNVASATLRQVITADVAALNPGAIVVASSIT